MLVSVITVTRNNLPGLTKTWESIRNQSKRDLIEWIVVDGDSSDGTKEFLSSNREIQSWISEKDNGIYDAQNKGIAKINGNYVIFLNAGDTLATPFIIENLLPYMEEGDSLIYGDVLLVGKEGNLSSTDYPSKISSRYWSTEKKYLCHQALFFNKSVFDTFGLYDQSYRYAADFEHLARIWNDPTFTSRKVNFVISVYSLDGVSADPKNSLIVYGEYSRILLKHFSILDYLLYNSAFVRRLRHIVFRISFLLNRVKLHRVTFFFSRIVFRVLGCFNAARSSRLRFRFSLKLDRKKKYRIVHLANDDSRGGAARSAVSIHRSLLNSEFDSLFISRNKGQSDQSIVSAPIKEADHLEIMQNDRKRANEFSTIHTEVLFSEQKLSYVDIEYILKELNPDIIHLHWIANNYISIEDISKVDKPIVWTMHDMWPFSGGYHIDLSRGYEYGYSEKTSDTKDREVWLRKNANWKGLKIFPVGVSRWMAEAASNSLLFKDRKVSKISNIVDTSKFPMIERLWARKHFGLPLKDKIVLFGSDYVDSNKNNQVLLDLIQRFEDKNILFLSFGHRALLERSINYYHLGYIEDDVRLSNLYAASDVFVVPSKIESFCFVAAESIACGVPVVSFDTSGLKDIVIDGETGYKAKCYDTDHFGELVLKVLEEGESKFSKQSLRNHIIENFSVEKVRDSYLELYRALLN